MSCNIIIDCNIRYQTFYRWNFIVHRQSGLSTWRRILNRRNRTIVKIVKNSIIFVIDVWITILKIYRIIIVRGFYQITRYQRFVNSIFQTFIGIDSVIINADVTLRIEIQRWISFQLSFNRREGIVIFRFRIVISDRWVVFCDAWIRRSWIIRRSYCTESTLKVWIFLNLNQYEH